MNVHASNGVAQTLYISPHTPIYNQELNNSTVHCSSPSLVAREREREQLTMCLQELCFCFRSTDDGPYLRPETPRNPELTKAGGGTAGGARSSRSITANGVSTRPPKYNSTSHEDHKDADSIPKSEAFRVTTGWSEETPIERASSDSTQDRH